MLEIFIHLFAVRFSSVDEVTKNDGVVNYLNVECEESAERTDANTVDVVVIHHFLQVGNVIKRFGINDFLHSLTYRV